MSSKLRSSTSLSHWGDEDPDPMDIVSDDDDDGSEHQSSSTSSQGPSVPCFPPEPQTPMPKSKGKKKKRSSTTPQLTPHTPRGAPSVPASPAPSPSPAVPTTSGSAASTSTQPGLSLTPDYESVGKVLDILADLPKALGAWSTSDWDQPRDKMRIAQALYGVLY